MNSPITFLFDDIFPTYTEWRQFSEQLTVTPPEASADVLAFDKYCYNVLFRNFAKQNIRYETVEQFINALANVYESKFQQFMREKQLVDSIYQLTNEELATVSRALTNMANNPNDAPADPLQPLSYISAQTVSQLTNNKLQAYAEALRRLPMLNIEKFIYGDRGAPANIRYLNFGDLFMNVLPQFEYYFEKGEN